MPFSTLTDPIDLARAQAALETAWAEIRPALSQDTYERERTRLAYAVAALASIAEDEDDLARRAVERYRSQS